MTVAVPATVVAGGRLETLELILGGMLGPVDGYRLPGAAPADWPVVPGLRVDAAAAERAVEHGSLELRDPDTTPLAMLSVDGHAAAPDGSVWVSGTVTRLRAPEHGPARANRLTPDTDFGGRTVALFRFDVRPADVLRVVRHAGEAPLDFVVEGASDQAASRSVATLQDCAEVLGDARVFYLPVLDADAAAGADTALFVLRGLGARDLVDVRREDGADRGGAVLLLTGLSGSGKSTVARALADRLRACSASRVVLLDGDHVRAELAGDLGFSAEDRDRNLQRQAWVGARVAEAGALAICAPIAPFAASRAAMRSKVEPASPFIVIHVSTPLAVAESRDRKGLYARARAGLISDFTGIDSPYEEPLDADLAIDTSELDVDACVDAVLAVLRQRGIID